MAASTVGSGRWQLPGGTVEPPPEGHGLDGEVLACHASRELSEEVGLTVARRYLRLWAVTRGKWGNIGVHFRAPARSADTLRDAYAALTSREREQGLTSELDRIGFIRSGADIAQLGGPTADFLPVLAALHADIGPAAATGSGR